MDALHGHDELQLVLKWQGREFLVGEQGLIVGRGDGAELRLRPGCVSRMHAAFSRNERTGQYELRDVSTNGTFLQSEDDQVVHVHRRAVPLWGQGYLGFGEPLSEERVVQFEHV